MRKLQRRRIDGFVFQCMEKITKALCHNHVTSVEDRMNASAFRDIWVGVIFFKFSKLHEPHEMLQRSYEFFIFNILKE